jgi:hypothetical protein
MNTYYEVRTKEGYQRYIYRFAKQLFFVDWHEVRFELKSKLCKIVRCELLDEIYAENDLEYA